MYNLVKESALFYRRLQNGQGYRESLVEPLLLLTDNSVFNSARENNEPVYQNLCDIIVEMERLYKTGDNKYHAFGNFLRELECAGFDISSMKKHNIISESMLHDQIELIRMFMCFKYYPK